MRICQRSHSTYNIETPLCIADIFFQLKAATREDTSRLNHPHAAQVFHGSQWGSIHRSLVQHIVLHPLARSIMQGMENTLLPDEAFLQVRDQPSRVGSAERSGQEPPLDCPCDTQTVAVNSPWRRTIIANHLRFIEWPQLHGDANKYWASLGPQVKIDPKLLTHFRRWLVFSYCCYDFAVSWGSDGPERQSIA